MESERKPETESEMESERKPETESEMESETESEMESERKPETESEMEPGMKFYDDSLWHHLVFVEELADNDRNKPRCDLCEGRALGPVYKCLECNFIQHKSCPKPTGRINWEKERMTYHNKKFRHHLMLVEEVANIGEEEVCYGCEAALSTPAYKCSIPGCSFLFHHSCAQLPLVVQHPTHRQDYMLTLQSKRYYQNPKYYPRWFRNIIVKTQGKKCNFCVKTSKYLFYGCEALDFHIHIKCLPLLQTSYYGNHEHRVFPTLMADPFPCQACGEESRFFAFTCAVCRLIMEKSCCDFSHSIQTTLHGHYLTFTPSVRQINKQDRIFCRACRKRVNTKYGAYYCVTCGYILHLKCARWYEDWDATIDESVPECDEHTKYLVEGLEEMEGERFDGPEKIKHFNHPEHELLLEQHEEPGYDKRCEACMRFIFFVPYYGCVLCNFFLHSRCAELPMTITRRLFHEHPLTLCSQTPSREKIFQCFGCHLYHDGYSYKCKECSGFQVHVQCGLIPEDVSHTLHEHTLFLVDENNKGGKKCNNCNMFRVSYICNNDCEFSLCLNCITLPLYVKYRYHSHPLTITNTCDNSKEYYCLICEEKRKPKSWFYWCKECDFTVHCDCILKGNFKDYGHYVSEDHEHPLFFVQKTEDSPPCEACGQPFDTWRTTREISKQAVECRRCKFVIHRRCQRKMFTKQS